MSTFVIFMKLVSQILELVVRNSAPIPSVAELFFLTLPTAFKITIPIGVLVGILIALSRMAADSEVTAMRAAGVSVRTFLKIIATFGVVAWLAALANTTIIEPSSEAIPVALRPARLSDCPRCQPLPSPPRPEPSSMPEIVLTQSPAHVRHGSNIGQPLTRREGVLKVKGEARYAAEVCIPALGAPAADLAARMESVQEVLGGRQDSTHAQQVLLELMSAPGAGGPEGFVCGALWSAEQQLAGAAEEAYPVALARAEERAVRHWLG